MTIINALSACGAGLESFAALAAVAAHRVHTAAVLADARLGSALVQVHTALPIRASSHSWWTDTHEGADEVFADHAPALTVIQPLRTLILVSTHPLILPQHVACRTHALVRTERVHTAEGTEQRVHSTLINIFTTHHGPRFKPLLTGALEASYHVSAGAVATRVSNRTLVRIHAFDTSVIQVVAEGTFTAEGAIGVDADAIFTRVIQTLIHIHTTFS